MERLDAGYDYWVICRRFNAHKLSNPGIKEVAVSDMVKLQGHTKSEAVRKRVNQFIARNQGQSPGNHGGNGGGRVA